MPGKMTVLNDDELLKACRRLQPGEFFSFDYRSPKQLEYNQNLIKLSEKVQQGGLSHDEKALLRPLKVMTWNIERGYKLKDIICHIKAADPDIICIQEIDSGCDRSFNVDTGIAIARALNLNYIFQLEFIELHSASASADPTFHGVHGNGIMSKFDFGESFSLDHPTQPYNWDKDGVLLNEPRIGRRFSFGVAVKVPKIFVGSSCMEQTSLQVDTSSLVDFVCYTCHMELFCGITDRIKILSELFDHSRQLVKRGYVYQALLGDFNTLAHSLARFSPKYCRDNLRWATLGWTEAQWMAAQVFDFYDSDGNVNSHLPLWGLQLDQKVLADIRNPYFEECLPSDVETLTNYNGWFYGKLDWALTRAVATIKYTIGNNDYSASDHKSILLEVFLDQHRANVIQEEEKLPTTKQVVSLWGDVYDELPNTLRGQRNLHKGIQGYAHRNCTTFVKQSSLFFCLLCSIFFYVFK